MSPGRLVAEADKHKVVTVARHVPQEERRKCASYRATYYVSHYVVGGRLLRAPSPDNPAVCLASHSATPTTRSPQAIRSAPQT